MLKKIVIFSCLGLAACGLAFSIYVWLAARAAIEAGAKTTAVAGQESLYVRPLRPASSRFEPVFPAPDFRSAVEFAGDLYICGSSALFRYSEGELKQTWYAGRELPPTRLSLLAVRTGIPNPELWIATDGAGVLIYNGSVYRQFLPEKVSLRRISALLPLANGRLLLGTASAGLYVTDGQSLRPFHPELSKLEVTALAGDEDQFWVGTRANGAWLWRGGEALHVTADLPDPQVLSMAAERDRAWIGTPIGIAEFKDGALTRRLADGIFAQTLLKDSDSLWVGTVDQGTYRIPLKSAKPRPQFASTSDDTRSVISFARLSAGLAAVESDGVIGLPDAKTRIVPPPNALSSNHITALHEDARGRLWIGYFDRGMDLLPSSVSTQRVHFEDDTLFCVNRVKENPRDSSILAATANGLAVFDSTGKLRQVLTGKNGLIASNITDLLFEPGESDGPQLVVATPAGLSFLSDGSISSLYAFHGLVNNHVYTLSSFHGALYAGTLGGVSSLRRGLVQASFNTANSQLRQNWITASAVFRDHLYLGTYGSGVVQFDDGTAIQSFPAFSVHRVEINLNAMIATDRALYAGTAGQGLAILRAGDERWEFVSAGLPSLNVTALEAKAGRLYVGTDNGLVQISESNLLP